MSSTSRPPRPHSTWRQQALFTPDVVRVDFTWFADVAMQRMQFGWTVSHGVEEQVMAMEVLPWLRLEENPQGFTQAALHVIQEELRQLPPFP